jgi:DnaK suppressor protein
MAKQEKINGLTPTQRAELQEMLRRRRRELLENIETRRQRDTKVEASENKEELDQASHSQLQAVSLRVMDKESKLLKQIDRALAKFEDGEYGLCEGTEEPIGYARLKAVPWARHSVAYKEEREREQQLMTSRLPGR